MSAASPEFTGHDTALLLRLLKPGGSAGLDWLQEPRWDWRGFAKACNHHHVASFVYCRLRGLPGIAVPPGLLEHLRARFLECSARNYHLALKLVDLTVLLEEHQIPALAYKGPTLALAAYGDLTLRFYSDLDVVVRPEHCLKAVAVMTRCGFEIAPTWWNPWQPENSRFVARHHEIALRAPDKSHFVDIHWQLAAYEARGYRLDADQVWSRAEKVQLLQGKVSTLCREDLFLALCCHGTWHRWSCLKWLLDIAQLLRDAGTLDWSRIEEMTRNRPLVRESASLAVMLASELLESDVPAEAARVILPADERTRAIAADIRDEMLLRGQISGPNATLGLEGSRVAWMKYWGAQVGWLFHQVFVQVTPKERAQVPLPERLQFLYHFIRPVRLALKHSRRVARALWPKAAV